MLWTWIFTPPSRPTSADHLSNAIREELFSLCRAQALDTQKRMGKTPDCGCLSPE